MRVSRLRDVPGIGVDRVGDEADAAGDPSILRLENLDTDLRPPLAALDATRHAVGEDAANSYLPFLGHDALRQAACAHVERGSGRAYDWRRSCLISAGGLSGILSALLALLEPGDEVILCDPIYAGLLNRVRIAGGVPRLAPLLPTPYGWLLDVASLRAAVSPKTRVLLMMSPAMPTGAVLSGDDWEAVAEICRDTGAWLLYDAAMERILYDGRPYVHPASLPGMEELTVTVGSLSKEYRMIGWRIGWVVGPAEIIGDVALVSMANVVCQVGIAQAAATAALTTPDDGVAEAVREWQRRRDLLLLELARLPVVPPAGGWSLLLDVAALGLDAGAASRRLMDVGRIAATPMTGWGSDAAGAYVRFVFANEPCERLAGCGDRVRRALS
ncbi:MAG: pyridoxal phosphate-dependent aminotransferase [Vulcanimicrobiaceae bacterium]